MIIVKMQKYKSDNLYVLKSLIKPKPNQSSGWQCDTD